MNKYFNMATVYLIVGLALGVFNREFTKLNNYEGVTILSATHTHALVLGFMFMLILLLIEKSYKLSQNKGFKWWFVTYNTGVIYLLVTLVIRGVLQVSGGDFGGLNHIAGLGHAILGISLIWFMIIFKKSINIINEKH